MNRSAVARVVVVGALIAWAAFWFWAFSFAYSDGFFEYNRHARIPSFIAALLAAFMLPISAFTWWLRSSASSFRALVGHVATCLAILAAPAAVTAVQSRAGHPWRLESDDAMGVGINYICLLAIAVVSVAVMIGAIGVRSYRRTVRHSAGAD